MSKIKVSDLWNEVVKVSRKHPERVYDKGSFGTCSYQRDGKPSCIVGNALNRLGVPIEDLQEFDTELGDTSIGNIASTYEELFEIDSEAALECLTSAQNNQDQKVPWGEAVKAGEDL